MKLTKQVILCIVAMIALGVFIAFLLHVISDKATYNQSDIESKLPERLQEETRENPTIRVLIKSNGFKNTTHTSVELCAKEGLIVKSGEEEAHLAANEVISIKPDDLRFEKGSIIIRAKDAADKITINSLSRGYGTPSYRGFLELYTTAEGIVIVNEILLEEYLCAVVPSEMPASYQAETLKVQAICARSYAHNQMQELSYPEYGAHVDDSVSFQVYNNSEEQVSTTLAVSETAGEKLWYNNKVARTYFYSTSSGHTTSVEAWGTELTEANQYLKGVSLTNKNGEAYEKDLAWFKWTARVPSSILCNNIELNTKQEIGTIQDIQITKRGVGNVALQMVITGTEGSITVETENKIRRALGGEGYEIKKQDGTVIDSTELLPSAFFSIEKDGDIFTINGGGYGHGIGMSQNGANELAKTGKSYKEILEIFYPGTKVE